MPQFRFQGKTKEGKTVRREFEAPGKKEAKDRVQKLAESRGFLIEQVDQRKTFIYKVHKNGAAAFEGEQEAYSADEVERALKKMGYKVDFVRKKLFDFKGGVPNDEVVTFIRLSADLLSRNCPTTRF